MKIWDKFSDSLSRAFRQIFYTRQFHTSPETSLDNEVLWKFLAWTAGILLVALVSGFFLASCTLEKSPNAQGKGSNDESSDSIDGLQFQSGALVIDFDASGKITSSGTPSYRNVGTLVRVRLQNTLESVDSAPAFAQVVDLGLGEKFYGATLIGEGSGDANLGRIRISFRKLKPVFRSERTLSLQGHALSLDGTLGVRAERVEGFAARSVLRGASGGLAGGSSETSGSSALGDLLVRALFQGLRQEAAQDIGIEHNQAQLLRLKPGTEFYVQLTDDLKAGGGE